MSAYTIYGNVDHKNKSYNIRLMPDQDFMKLYGHHMKNEGWIGTDVPFILFHMKLNLDRALLRKSTYESDYASQGYVQA
jgi:hypothetical protein